MFLLKCKLSSCGQGDVGMEGPRGGVGRPGETVRNQPFSHDHTLIISGVVFT